MTKKEKEILDTFAKVIPTLSERDKDRLLLWGEGLGFRIDKDNKDKLEVS